MRIFGGKFGHDLVWHDPATTDTKIVVPAEAFIPPDNDPETDHAPLNVESFQFSEDESKLLIFTNSRRVWRRNTRGDYWVLDIEKRELKKLGGDAQPSMMFAKFSPNGYRVAFVRDNNLFVQNLSNMEITALTKDGSPTLINGTSDWVYEEELDLRDGYRWSPTDGRLRFGSSMRRTCASFSHQQHGRFVFKADRHSIPESRRAELIRENRCRLGQRRRSEVARRPGRSAESLPRSDGMDAERIATRCNSSIVCRTRTA